LDSHARFINNTFDNNAVNKGIAMVETSVPIVFEGYNEFSNNTVDSLITLSKYILLHEGATLNI